MKPLQWIIAYKAIKGSALMLAGLGLTVALWRGEGEHLHALAETLRAYVTARLTVELAELLLNVSTPGHLAITSLALGADGTVGIVEAWLLHRGQRWAIWLVVAASSTLIPWELYALFTQFSVLRVIVLTINLAVVVYLVRTRPTPAALTAT